MGHLEDQLDPRDRAEADAQRAAVEAERAAMLAESAGNFDTMAKTFADMGYDQVAKDIGHEATRETVSAAYDNVQGRHWANAAHDWTVTADSLDQQAKARGEAFVARAEHSQAEDMLQQAHTGEDTTHLTVASAATGAMATALDERAVQLGHDAEAAGSLALDEEAMARGTHE